MAEYWGLEVIATRLGIVTSTLKLWHRDRHFLMYRRRRGRRELRLLWFTNDALIMAWELEQCRAAWAGAWPQEVTRSRRLRQRRKVSAVVPASLTG